MILGIIQARMGSHRLPGKSMKKICGIPLVELVMERCLRSILVDKWVVATTALDEDKSIKADFRWDGDPNNVLGRFIACGDKFGADIIVRVTADDPFKDPSLIDEAIGYMLRKPGLDYCSNTIKPSFPWGLDIEVVRLRTLKWIDENVRDDLYREHVTYYITEHPEEFKTFNFCYREDLHGIRLSIDTAEDLRWVNRFFSETGADPVNVGYEEVIKYAKAYRERSKIRAGGAIA